MQRLHGGTAFISICLVLKKKKHVVVVGLKSHICFLAGVKALGTHRGDRHNRVKHSSASRIFSIPLCLIIVIVDIQEVGSQRK